MYRDFPMTDRESRLLPKVCIGCCRCLEARPTDAILRCLQADSQCAARSVHRLRQLHRKVSDRGAAHEADADHPATLGHAQTIGCLRGEKVMGLMKSFERLLGHDSGGVHPADHKRPAADQPVRKLPLPSRVHLLLQQHVGAAARPVVLVGQKVKKGELIAAAQGNISAPLHASTSGTISAIGESLRRIPRACRAWPFRSTRTAKMPGWKPMSRKTHSPCHQPILRIASPRPELSVSGVPHSRRR